MSRKILIIGAGGHGRSVAEALMLCFADTLLGFVDDSLPVGSLVMGVPILGRMSQLVDLRRQTSQAIVAIGNNDVRARLFEQSRQIGFTLCSIIHPRAIVSQYATISSGVTVMAGAVIGCQSRLEDGVIVNAGAIVDHDCVLEAFSHLGVGVAVAGGNRIGAHAWLPAGSVVGYQSDVPVGYRGS